MTTARIHHAPRPPAMPILQQTRYRSTTADPRTRRPSVPPQPNGRPQPRRRLQALQYQEDQPNRSLHHFLANDPDRAAKIQGQINLIVPLTNAGHLNSIMPATLRVLETTGLPVSLTDGITTAYTRAQLNIPKSQVNDDSCSPADRGFPAYSRLPRAQQDYTRPPAHSIGPRRLRGIRTGDMVRLNHHSGRTITGRAKMGLKKKDVKIKGPTTAAAKVEAASLVTHTSRWNTSIRVS